MKKRVGVLMGGMGSEREISFKTGAAFVKSVKNLNYPFEVIDVGPDLPSVLSKTKIDCALLALHGKYGEDGTVQGILEYMKIPYSGSGVLASALAMHKVATKQILSHWGIPNPDYEVVSLSGASQGGSFMPKSLELPVVVKPTHEGSSVGVTIVRRKDDFKKAFEVAAPFGRDVLIESFIDGMEVTVPIWMGKILPIIEIIPRTGEYDFKRKYTPGESEHIIPARLSKNSKLKCEQYAFETFNAIGCRHYARVDIRLDQKGNPFVLELNTLPGCTETSLFPESAAKAGISFDQFIETLIENATLDYL